MSNDFLHDAVSRRVFLARMAAAGLGTAAAALIAGCGGSSNSSGPNPRQWPEQRSQQLR